MDLSTAAKLLRPHRPLAYAAAIIGPLIACWLRFVLNDQLSGLPYLTFFPTVLIAAFLGGAIPGVIAALLSGVLAGVFFSGSVAAPHNMTPKILGLVFFALVSGTMIALVSALRRLNEALERRVEERTRELAAANAALKTEIVTREASEARVRQTQKMEALGQLTGGIAHDFNNMLAIVVGNLDMARRRLGRGDANVGALIDNAVDGAQSAAALTRRLLALSRRQPLSPSVIDPNALVESVAELLRSSIGAGVELACVFAESAWRVRADAGELENAIVNLAVNARDAMAEGGRLTIETANVDLDAAAGAMAGVPPGQYCVISVTDDGVGMSPEIAARVFDPFFTTKDVGEGSGLGLSQVYGFVKQSGGYVSVTTQPGQGACFRIYLQRCREEESAAPAEAAASAPAQNGETVLVVEDDDNVRKSTTALLRELGYHVREAANGRDALAALDESADIGLLFTDVMMPGMSGCELAEAASRRQPSLKILYATGFIRGAPDGSKLRQDQVLMKPFSIDQLAGKLRAVFDAQQSA